MHETRSDCESTGATQGLGVFRHITRVSGAAAYRLTWFIGLWVAPVTRLGKSMYGFEGLSDIRLFCTMVDCLAPSTIGCTRVSFKE